MKYFILAAMFGLLAMVSCSPKLISKKSPATLLQSPAESYDTLETSFMVYDKVGAHSMIWSVKGYALYKKSPANISISARKPDVYLNAKKRPLPKHLQVIQPI